MKSYSVLWEVGLQVKMKSSPASVTILATGWQANRSSPRNTGRNGASRAVLGEPAPDSVAFAVLLFGAVLGGDEFRRQRHDLGVAGRHDRRRQHRMVALGLAVGALARQAVRAAEFLRAEELRSVQGDLGPSAQPAEGLPHRRLAQQRLHTFEAGLQQRGVRLVQKIADVIVGGNSADAEQRPAIGAAVAFLHRALVG